VLPTGTQPLGARKPIALDSDHGRTQDGPSDLLNVHALLPHSRANGPGVRAVIWLQGCLRQCPGCFNPDLLPVEPRQLLTPRQLWEWTESVTDIEGVTLSGGEPMLQAEALVEYLGLLRASSPLSVLLYTGYYLEENPSQPFGSEVLALVDVLVDGPYDQSQPAHDGLRGSANQRLHLLTGRYALADLQTCPRFEVVLPPDGSVVRTGVSIMPAPPRHAASLPRSPG